MNMKKKILGIILGMTLLMGQVQGLAAFPPIQYGGSESIEFAWSNPSKIGTISAKGAAFQLEFYPKTADVANYTVSYSIDEGNTVTTTVSVPPAVKTVKSFGINVANGIHQLTATIARDGSVLKEIKQTFYVMDLYSHQFMEELSGRGVNVHLGRVNWQQDVNKNLEILHGGGYRVVRSGTPSWSSMEKTKGVYDFTNMDKYYGWLKSKNVKSYDLLTYGNGLLYPPERSMNGTESWPTWEKTQLQTHDSIWAWARFAVALAEHNPNPIGFELWNEPNHYTEETYIKAQKYVDYVKPTTVLLDYNNHDTIDIAPFSLAYNDELNFVDTCLRFGLYPYFNSVAHHPYVWQDGFTANQMQEERMFQIERLILKYGGWKDREITEIGYPTTTANNTPTEESAAIDIVKTFVVSEAHDNEVTIFYDLINDGVDGTYTEDNFGQVTLDGKPKLPYMTTAAFNIKTEGGIYVGEIDLGIDRTTRAFLYYKDGKPVVVAWSNQMDKSSVEWKLDGESVTVHDAYGNLVSENADRVLLEEMPFYVEGLSKSWCARAVHDEVTLRNSKWLTAYASNLSDEDRAEIKSIMNQAEKSFVGTPSAEAVLEQLENMRDFGLKIISYAADDRLEDVEVSKMLYELFRIMQRIDNLYVTAYEGDVPEALTSRTDETYQKARELYKHNLQIMQYSDEMLRHAMRYTKNAKTVMGLEENPSKAGVVKGWNIIADMLCDWFDAFTECEAVIETGYLIQTPYYDRISYINSNVTMEVNLDNYSRREFNGTIKIFDEDGELAAQSEQLKISGDGGHKQIYMKVNTKRPTDGSGFRHYFISYVDNNGNIIATQPTDIQVKDKFKAEVLPCTQPTDKLDKVSLKISNLTKEKAVAHVQLKSDENFSFLTNNIEVTLDPSESKVVDVPIANIRDTKYHFYSFSYEVTDDDGNIVASSDAAMSFTTVVKANKPISVEDFDGDISDWEDAYPIYINSPKNVTDPTSWETAECSTRAFVKWDADNLYVLADVYDEAYLQEFSEVNMWQGDCIQLSLDPKNDGTQQPNGYGTDDYELGFSYTAKGNEFYAWTSPNSLKGGVVDWFKIIRNDDLHITRYLIRLDKSIITSLDLAEGNVLGMNLAVNDADVLGRENYYQFTLGTADKKNPDDYADFTLSSVTPKNVVDGLAETLFPVKLEATEIVFEGGFEDISEHWAKEAIEAMYKKGIVKGVDEKHFVPDALITRAELFQMIVNLAGYDKAEYNGAFSDVNGDDWYAPAVQALSNNSMIPGAMVTDGKILPNQEITREEAVYFATNLCYVVKMTKVPWYNWGELTSSSTYPDGDQISEWIRPMFDIAVSKKFIVGSNDGNLYPKSTITRAEATALLQRTIPYML